MRFSERIGKRAPKDIIQIDSMDDDLRNRLWSALDYFLFKSVYKYGDQAMEDNIGYDNIYAIWNSLLKKPVDTIPYFFTGTREVVRQMFFAWNYLDVYDLIDFLAQLKNTSFDTYLFVSEMNLILEQELSGYRLVSNQLTPIISESDMQSIEKAVDSKGLYKGASIHLSAALEKLSDRREPDYRNSIKESISAVESVCQAITGDPKATLGPALKRIEQKMPLHGALKEGLLKIYGYTSDSDGIRHALQDEPNLSQEDALFMLVTCSAFVNYLTVKADKAGAAGS